MGAAAVTDRDSFIARLRAGLGVSGEEAGRRESVLSRLKNPPRGVIPTRGQLAPAARLALFRTMAAKSLASVATIADAGQVPAAIAEYLRGHNLPAAFRSGDDPRLAVLPWERVPQLVRHLGPAQRHDAVGVSQADAGIAETGTLLLASGRANPTTLAFLPETHIVVVAAADVVGDYETAIDALRKRLGDGFPPRTINLITGPSRSADIEQTMLLGAHGPRRLHIILVDPAG
jgi:L-lactate dehydrogenase complex protein LldG